MQFKRDRGSNHFNLVQSSVNNNQELFSLNKTQRTWPIYIKVIMHLNNNIIIDYTVIISALVFHYWIALIDRNF